jgi:putative hydrolase of the HAD superfamily
VIKLLTFDLDDTLWDVKSIVVRAEKTMRAWISVMHPEFVAKFDFSNFAILREAVLRERADIAHDLTQLRLEVLRRAFRQAGYSPESAEAAAQGAFAEFFRERNTVEYFPGAIAALTDLHHDFEMYALSNGTADIQRIGLDHLLTKQFSAISVGAAKPDPRMFLAAIAAAGVEPQEVIHIGDHPCQDVAAASAVGMKTIWVNLPNQPWPEKLWPELKPADAELKNFAELRLLVQHLATETN